MDKSTSEIHPCVEEFHGVPRATSLTVAEHFGRRHDDVLRRIHVLECSSQFNAHNFAVLTYRDAQGENRPLVKMTKDGFMLLSLGYTGSEAMKIREAYLAEFDRMAKTLTFAMQPPLILPAGQSRLLLTLEAGVAIHSRLLREDEILVSAAALVELWAGLDRDIAALRARVSKFAMTEDIERFLRGEENLPDNSSRRVSAPIS
jgi:Rha family phage regulatory protein